MTMIDILAQVTAALKILKEENKDRKAIGILEDSIKTLCKHYIMDMSAMSSVIGFEQVEQELKNGLKLLNMVSDRPPKNS